MERKETCAKWKNRKKKTPEKELNEMEASNLFEIEYQKKKNGYKDAQGP